ncbi:MAG: family 16 glycoside hydrolase, partial [Verrucomicrobiota bacterium]
MALFRNFLITIGLAIAASAHADHHGGFVDLFNGKDLSGWTASKENPDSYSVKDGKLVVKGGRSHLFYTGDVNGG